MHADSHQSDISAYLSVILLVCLALNALLGWWWTDPVAALCQLPEPRPIEAFGKNLCG